MNGLILVRHYEHRRALVRRTPEHPQRRLGVLRVQSRGRFVGEDRLRPHHQRPRHSHPTQFPSRELIGASVGQGRQIDALQQGLRPLADPLLLDSRPDDRREEDVLQHRQAAQRGVPLRDHADPLVAERRGRGIREGVQILAVNQDGPLRRREDPRHHRQQGALTAPRASANHQQLAGAQAKIHRLDRREHRSAAHAREVLPHASRFKSHVIPLP